MRRVHYSQYSTYSTCQQKYKLRYIDRVGIRTTDITLVFGTSMHEVIQEYLQEVFDGGSFEGNLKFRLRRKMLEALESYGLDVDRKVIKEFAEGGDAILDYFLDNFSNFYDIKEYELVGIEKRVSYHIKRGIKFSGLIDILIRNKTTGELVIIDLKTSKMGWSKYQKRNKVKTSQMLLYKRFYSLENNVDEKNIRTEYQILKRKLREAEFVIPRISKFVPANGKRSVDLAWKSFMNFVETVYNEDGEVIQEDFPANKSRACEWCQFKERGLCSAW